MQITQLLIFSKLPQFRKISTKITAKNSCFNELGNMNSLRNVLQSVSVGNIEKDPTSELNMVSDSIDLKTPKLLNNLKRQEVEHNFRIYINIYYVVYRQQINTVEYENRMNFEDFLNQELEEFNKVCLQLEKMQKTLNNKKTLNIRQFLCNFVEI